MPIDFNSHFYMPNVQPNIVNAQLIKQNQLMKDTFIKSVDLNYDGIKIEQKSFGKIKKTGEEALLFTITNKNGAKVDLSTYGATVTGIKVPDRTGKLVDVTQGYNKVSAYEECPVGHAGGTIGPYANKISDGKFELNGEIFQLECNKDNGKSHSHGGSEGFDVKNWDAKVLQDGIEFTYIKPDMENNYPGNVETKVTYKFDNNNQLHIIYSAKSDKDTIINLTNHTYFNLDGTQNAKENSVLDHFVTLPNSTKITKVNELGIPTGEFLKVKDSPFDFKSAKQLKDVIYEDNEQLKLVKGFDHNYCIDGYDGKSLIEAAKIESDKSGIVLKVYTNLPGFQFYTANNLGKPLQPNGKQGQKYEKRSGLCVEPQFYPNAINTQNFSDKGVLLAGEEYNREIVYSFGLK